MSPQLIQQKLKKKKKTSFLKWKTERKKSKSALHPDYFIIKLCKVYIALTSLRSTHLYVQKFSLVYLTWVSVDLGGTKHLNRPQYRGSNGK